MNSSNKYIYGILTSASLVEELSAGNEAAEHAVSRHHSSLTTTQNNQFWHVEDIPRIGWQGKQEKHAALGEICMRKSGHEDLELSRAA